MELYLELYLELDMELVLGVVFGVGVVLIPYTCTYTIYMYA